MYLWNFHWFRTLIGYCLEDSKRLQEIRLMLLQWAHCVANAPWTCWLKSLALKISVGNSTAGQLDSPVYVKAYFSLFFNWSRASQVVLVVKNPPANAGDLRDKGLIPGLGRFPGIFLATHSSILFRRILWTEEPGGLRSMGLQRVGHDWSDLAHIVAAHHKEKANSGSLVFMCAPQARGHMCLLIAMWLLNFSFPTTRAAVWPESNHAAL